MRTFINFLMLMFFFISMNICAQTTTPEQKYQMQFIATFEAGQTGAGIYKLYDQSDDVICYVLMPDTASRKKIDGKWVYDANSLGSLSCLKANSPPKALTKNK